MKTLSLDFEAYAKKTFYKLSSEKQSSGDFYKSLNFSFFSGGKRLRPLLMLSLSQDLGLALKQVFPAALALELIHTYSLVHDDLPAMDNDIYRRGKLTHHAKYGEASAVLAGDAFLTLAFEVLAEAYTGKALKVLVSHLSQSSGANGMVGGQVLDCMTTHRSKEIFHKIHLLKTAKLFEFALGAVPTLLERSHSDVEAFRDLGQKIGLLFQLQDDLFDEEKSGDRLEENILSVVSKEELISMIEKTKQELSLLVHKMNLSEASNFQRLMKILWNRTH